MSDIEAPERKSLRGFVIDPRHNGNPDHLTTIEMGPDGVAVLTEWAAAGSGEIISLCGSILPILRI